MVECEIILEEARRRIAVQHLYEIPQRGDHIELAGVRYEVKHRTFTETSIILVVTKW